MAVSRVQYVDQAFRDKVLAMAPGFRRIEGRPTDQIQPGKGLTRGEAVSLLECQLTSRWIDYVARELKNEDKSFYTIGSAGHEGNAMVGLLTRPTDPAFLHYRSGGFMMARSQQVPGETPIFDTCLSLVASLEDPVSGGRHKVWGGKNIWVPPQTSTIASHLPKAMGMAFFMDRRKIMESGSTLPEDSVVVCSFGDASINHSTALGAVNAAAWCAYQHLPVPLLLVCEDNGLGISVKTPAEWLSSNYNNRAGLSYFQADGLDILDGYDQVSQAIRHCRERRRPTFLHLRTIRLLGHAGSDVEIGYRERAEIEAVEAMDPLITSARRVIEAGIMSPQEVIQTYEGIAAQVRAAGAEASTRPRHTEPGTLMAPLLPDYAKPLAAHPEDRPGREAFWQGRFPENNKPRSMGQLINWALHDLCYQQKDIVMFGEDVAKKGGVYAVTKGLYEKFGVGRVFNTVLDETSILGLAIGAGHSQLLPIPEIQYLAYLHNAIDQLRGEACSLKYFSNGQFANPMVVRIAGFAYQRGFGGHFHNDNAFAALREIPGLVLVTAANGADMVRLLRTAVGIARRDHAVVVVIEPIALYAAKDLVDKGDWLFHYPEPGELMAFGEAGFYGEEDADILVITYANGTYLSLKAAHQIRAGGTAVRVMDLRFLLPLNEEAIVEAARGRKAVVIVDECRQTASISEQIITLLVENLRSGLPRIERVVGEDTYIPLGTAWECVLPSVDSITQAMARCARG